MTFYTPTIEAPPAPRPQPDVRPLTATLGAVVEGLDLDTGVDDATVTMLRSLLDAHEVLFLPGQHLDADQHRRLAERFGALTVHPLHRLTGKDQAVSTIVDDENHPPAGFDWHTDLSWCEEPPSIGFLSGVEIPAVGGDTLWASGTAAWERLGPALQRACAGLQVLHRPDPTLLATVRRHHGREVADELAARHPGVMHPLVRRHPGTGRPVLWLSPLYTSRVIGMDERSGRALLEVLNRHLEHPEVQVRWRWTAGDLVLWDEDASCHRALTDHAPARRVVRRCTVGGTRPVPGGTDGRLPTRLG